MWSIGLRRGSVWGRSSKHITMICQNLQDVAPAEPVEESRVAIVINHPQQFKLLGQGALGIEAGISRPAAAVMASLSCLGMGTID